MSKAEENVAKLTQMYNELAAYCTALEQKFIVLQQQHITSLQYIEQHNIAQIVEPAPLSTEFN